jgi:excisionase family DNA binding protein
MSNFVGTPRRRYRSLLAPSVRGSLQAPRSVPVPVDARQPKRARGKESANFRDATAPQADAANLSNRLLTLEEAGKILRVGRTSAWEMVNAGDLSAVRIRGKLLIPCEAVERYVAELIEDARAVAEARRSLRRKSPSLADRR